MPLIEVDRGHLRLLVWMGMSLSLTLSIYSNQLTTLVSGLGDLLSSTLGTVFPAYPFLALLLVLTALRWKDFHRVLLTEQGLTSKPLIRLAGAIMILLPTTLWNLFYGSGGPPVYIAMELSACSLVLVAYGTLLVVNPTMWKMVLPYASLYSVGLLSPLLMLDFFGGPLAVLSSYLADGITKVLGVHVAWQGVAFAFVSTNGDSISAVVTPPCSAAYSISIYLALLGLMYLDVRRSRTTTVKFAIAGVAIIPLLNSARIALTIWSGYIGGSVAFWGIHDWLGYATFFLFYIVVLVTYTGMGKHRITYIELG